MLFSINTSALYIGNEFMNKYSLPLLAVIFSTVSLYATKPHAEDFYEVVDLGSFAESSYSNAYSINASNQIVGHGDGEGFLAHAFMYENGQLNSLGFLEYLIEADEDLGVSRDEGRSLSFDVNDTGIAVGYSLETQTEIINEGEEDEETITTFLEVPVVFGTNNSSITKIPSLESLVEGRNELQNARAISVNENGIVVGIALFDEPNDLNSEGDPSSILLNRGFVFDMNTQILIKISPLNGILTQSITLRDVDNSGYIVGLSTEIEDNFGFARVVGLDMVSPDVITEFDISGGSDRQVWSINENRKFVGVTSVVNSNDKKAYLYNIDDLTETDLGTLNNNFVYSEAFDINDNDQIVGISQTKSQPSIFSGFIYENGEMKDLSKMIGCDTDWIIHEARSINNNGFITGTGLLNGEARAFMLKPILNQTAPICEDDSLNTGSGSGSLISIFAIMSIFGVRRRYSNLNSSIK